MTVEVVTDQVTGQATNQANDQATDRQATDPQGKRPFYPRLLRLRYLRLQAWQRAVLGEGAIAAALLLVAADVATAWTLLVLPLAVAVVVKLNDVVAGALYRPARPTADSLVTATEQPDLPQPS